MRKDDNNKKTIERSGNYGNQSKRTTSIISRLIFTPKAKTENIPLTKKSGDPVPAPIKSSKFRKKMAWAFIGLIGLYFYIQSIMDPHWMASAFEEIPYTIIGLLLLIIVVGIFISALVGIRTFCLMFLSKKQTDEHVFPIIVTLIMLSIPIGLFTFIIMNWGK